MENEQIVENMRTILEHKYLVARFLHEISNRLASRAFKHDLSKFDDEEFYAFAKNLPKFKETNYGSEQYAQLLQELGSALDHHYQKNRHHPEHFAHGVNDMTLIDLIEMVCDWKAASLRTADHSLQPGQLKERFGISDQLYLIICNTIYALEHNEFGL